MSYSGKTLFYFFLLFYIGVFSQVKNKIDSLEKELKSHKKDDTITVNNLIVLGQLVGNNDFEKGIRITNEALAISKKINFLKGEAKSYNALGIIVSDKGDYKEALDFYQKSFDIRHKIGDKLGCAKVLSNMGSVFSGQDDYYKALNYHQKAYGLYQEIGDKKGMGKCLGNVGIIYYRLSDYIKSLDYQLKALKVFEDAGYKKGIAQCYSNLSSIYAELNNYNKLIEYASKAIKIAEEIDDKQLLGNSYNNLGNGYIQVHDTVKGIECILKSIKIKEALKANQALASSYQNLAILFAKQNKNDSAILLTNKSIKIREELSDKSGLISSYNNLCYIYTNSNNLVKAKGYCLLADKLSDEIKSIFHKPDIYKNLSDLYVRSNDYKLALEFQQKSIVFSQQQTNEEKRLEGSKKEMQYYFDKKLTTDSIQNIEQKKQDNLIHEKQIIEQKAFTYGGIIAFGLMLIIAISVFRNLKLQRRTNSIISLQKQEVEKQKHLIEEHQKETIDSINYAKRIQYALLANSDLLKQNLPEHFVLFNPKDIVSGDFYWATHHENKFYLAVCDSTGHGVPGAFMSLLNMGFLSEAIKEKGIYQPNEVLNYVRKRLIESIGNDGQQDGMDAILLCIDNSLSVRAESRTITYSAANNEPILITEGKIIELPKDKMPVGKGEKTESFTLQTIEAKKGDFLYLYTDGYADQFGGPKGKKFKYKALNDLLLANVNIPVTEQLTKLNTTLNNWKGELEQVDDVCIIGIRL